MDYHLLLFPVPVLLTILLWLHDHLAKPRTLIKKAGAGLCPCCSGVAVRGPNLDYNNLDMYIYISLSLDMYVCIYIYVYIYRHIEIPYNMVSG